MRRLLDDVLLPPFSSPALAARHDSAVVPLGGARVALTTDTYVVHPLFFPGGDIGKLAVCGTINDLAVAGSRPRFLTAGLVLEEGLELDVLERVVRSMASAAAAAGVELVTGDTKVVERGKGDGIFINTSGLGVVADGVDVRPARVRPGDAVLVSGDVGRHGVAILSVREGLEFAGEVESDCASLAEAVLGLLDAEVEVHCLRDLTRGGLAAALNEIALDARVAIEIREEAVPLHGGVRGACEILGLDPFHVACEGRFVAFVPQAAVEDAIARLRRSPVARGAAAIGRVAEGPPGTVLLECTTGPTRVLDLPSGDDLPRIC
jgi:hydrogenase expression/formation protein HypE